MLDLQLEREFCLTWLPQHGDNGTIADGRESRSDRSRSRV